MMVKNLNEVRQKIDEIDQRIITLIAERGEYVKAAAQFKKTAAQVAAPDRVAQVIEKVKQIATEKGADPELVGQVYQTMIAEFIALEHRMVKEMQ